MRSRDLLGIDVGSTNTKVVLVEASGRTPAVRALASSPTPDGVQDLVHCVLGLVRTVLGDTGPGSTGQAPAAVGIASMAETGAALGRSGEPLTGLVRWNAPRPDAELPDAIRDAGARALFAATGVRPSAKVPLVTWARMRTRDETLLDRMARWCGAADLIVLALTGDVVTDHTLAGRTMAYRMPPPGTPPASSFDPDLLALAGLAPDQLPRVAPPDAPAALSGRSRANTLPWWDAARAAFAEAGILEGTPVTVAGHDHAVAAWAAGVRRPGNRADSLGTAEAVMTILDEAPEAEAVRTSGASWVRTVSGQYDALLSGSPDAGALIAWWLDRHAAGRTPEDVFSAVRAELDADPGPTGTLVLPYLHGRQAPAPDADARFRVLAASGPVDVRLTRAVLEGLSLHARWMLEAQAQLANRAQLAGADAAGAGPAPGTGPGAPRAGPGAPGTGSDAAGAPGTGSDAAGAPVVLLPGAAIRNAAWLEIKAQVSPYPLARVDLPEPVATGAALLAGVRGGILGDDVPALLDGAAPVLPVEHSAPPATDPYARMFAEFVAAALGDHPDGYHPDGLHLDGSHPEGAP